MRKLHLSGRDHRSTDLSVSVWENVEVLHFARGSGFIDECGAKAEEVD